MTQIEKYLSTAESKKVTVLLWMLKNRDKDNLVNGTLESIAEECEVTKVTVNRIFQKLYAEGFLVKIRNSQYKIQNV